MSGELVTSTTALAEQEAVVILKEVLAHLSSGGCDVKLVLRKCIHTSNLLAWKRATEWFQCELYGYRADQEVPWYRKSVPATRLWRPNAIQDVITRAVEGMRTPDDETIEYHDVRWGIDPITSHSEKGVFVPSGKHESRWSRLNRSDIAGQEGIEFSKETMHRTVAAVENEIFRWASNAYVALRFGDTAGDIWRRFRAGVDEAITQLGFSGHLNEISKGLASEEPQAWRQAMWSCRDLLRDLAAYLWQDPRDNYDGLGNEQGKPWDVTPEKYINRLGAYLHQKGVTGTTGGYLRAELGRLHALNDLDSKAHETVAREDAELAALATYTVLGELVRRTDMEPVLDTRAPNEEGRNHG